MSERRAPVQGHWDREKHEQFPYGTISWAEHLEAYADYARRYGSDHSAERLAERGGFGWHELIDHLGREPTTWRPRA